MISKQSGTVNGASLQQVMQNLSERLQQSIDCHVGHLEKIVFKSSGMDTKLHHYGSYFLNFFTSYFVLFLRVTSWHPTLDEVMHW